MKYLVLDGAAMDFMDATGLEVMQAILLKAPRGLRVVLADPSRDLLDILKRGGVLGQLGENLHMPSCVIAIDTSMATTTIGQSFLSGPSKDETTHSSRPQGGHVGFVQPDNAANTAITQSSCSPNAICKHCKPPQVSAASAVTADGANVL